MPCSARRSVGSWHDARRRGRRPRCEETRPRPAWRCWPERWPQSRVHAGWREHDVLQTKLGRERLHPPAEEVGQHRDDAVGRVRPVARPRPERAAQPRERDDKLGEELRRGPLGVLDTGGDSRVGRERQGEREGAAAAAARVLGEVGREERRRGRRHDDGAAEAAVGREAADDVDERDGVALRRVRDDEDVHRSVAAGVGDRRHDVCTISYRFKYAQLVPGGR
ncbi:Os06g0282925 [Oryza sativa Japonica Group]|uniref:Os06g0282925 protein n=1 Tax=Oryza sativa subsp. japonica TaxID=39947 RepID=C7J3M4_ORYSJ|nr:Os06g0282925 [Oryza sativa Japonica Group]|eukprot:NP_001174718.1 Os06g0282925 [Oryza sativa Japonica Group]